MFEKDLYALIRGLRNHKGNEREYIQDSIKECRKEIRGSDMDQKATALLKLMYLEMFGHDMSWASFHVLEVMSSQKYLQKRVGYLGAVQSFRPDTEVLMLGENLLKKDISSPHPTTIHLPLVTIPHVVNPSMANSLLADLLPRVSHSHASIRKKTIVTLYRLALVYPETLRPTWPKLKERLLDENEDPSVTAAVVNVVCELGWRRPQDFLSLAPRLFDLLVHGGNNWMAIKIIKLFAILTPLEPRLVRKLLPPLTTLIKTTPAMSLLYECINGIIQGGILDGSEGTVEGDDIAHLCVSKLRGMLVIEGDPNLKYVALLALARIVDSHPQLVGRHADVILECIDDPDISIRTRALDLIVGMVDSGNLVPTVERLLRQLREATPMSTSDEPENARGMHEGVVPSADSDDDQAAKTLRKHEQRSKQPPPLPDDYRVSVLGKILELCSRDTYANVNDFDWYVGVLVELVRHCPATGSSDSSEVGSPTKLGIADSIGHELRNVAVRVKAVRPETTAAAQSLLLVERRKDMFPASGTSAHGVLGCAAWIAGEYASLLPDPDAVLSSLVHPTTAHLPASVMSLYLQAIPKVFVRITSDQNSSWSDRRKSHVLLLAARVIHFLEPIVLHPNLEVQERAVEYLELMRLASDAASAQSTMTEEDGHADAPLLLTQAIPALFMGMELNPVAAAALKKVPVEEGLDLSAPINDSLQMLLQQADYDTDAYGDEEDEVYKYYNERPAVAAVSQVSTAADLLNVPSEASSYQQRSEPMDASALERLKAERRQRYQDDPFYIDSERNSGTSTPLHNILKSSNGDELDIDAIPVMDLSLEHKESTNDGAPKKAVKKPKKRVEIATDETIGDDSTSSSPQPALPKSTAAKPKRSLLQVDSSALPSLSLSEEGQQASTQLDIERRAAEEEEMRRALKEVERLRLEMQRASERVVDPGETAVVKRKKKKKKVNTGNVEDGGAHGEEGDAAQAADKVVKKKKKKKKVEDGDVGGDDVQVKDEDRDAAVKTKKKKKRTVVLEEPDA
ncbi:hypothetical protein MBLNU457_1888t1 [Dothideomycetes sp. NU457]